MDRLKLSDMYPRQFRSLAHRKAPARKERDGKFQFRLTNGYSCRLQNF